MSFEDFKKIYEGLDIARTISDEYEGTLKGLRTAGILEQMLKDETGIEIPELRDKSARAVQAVEAEKRHIARQKEMFAYTKTNLDEILGSYDKKNVIRAASLGVQNYSKDDKSEIANYLTAYRTVELLKVEEDTEDRDDRSRKRKKRLTAEKRSEYTGMILPFIIKERLRKAGKIQEKDLDSYSLTIANLAAHDRSYVANAMNEGQELLGKRIEQIGGVEDYIKRNLQKDEDYFLFARSLGEAYTLTSPVNP